MNTQHTTANKTGLKTQVYDIAIPEGKHEYSTETVTGEVTPGGCYGIHWRENDGVWVITHLATGLCVNQEYQPFAADKAITTTVALQLEKHLPHIETAGFAQQPKYAEGQRCKVLMMRCRWLAKKAAENALGSA